MKRLGEKQDLFPARHLAGEFEGAFNGVRPGWAGKLHLVMHVSRLKNSVPEFLQKPALGDGGHVQAMGDAIALDVFQQTLFHGWGVVAIIQCSRTSEKVQVGDIALVVEAAAFPPGK